MQIWYPDHEYYLDLTQNILSNFLESGLLTELQVKNGLSILKDLYFKLVDVMRSELDLSGDEFNERIKIIDVNEEIYRSQLEQQKDLDLSFFKFIYGSWIGNDIRQIMYKNLVLKHIQPALEGVNTLHLDNSYELWPDILGASYLQRVGQTGTSKDQLGRFSWISYPTLPSISLSHMREFNAPNSDKLYIGTKSVLFKKQVEKLSSKYIQFIAPLILDKPDIDGNDQEEIVLQVKNKLLAINRELTN
jgi:hypothetical protein